MAEETKKDVWEDDAHVLYIVSELAKSAGWKYFEQYVLAALEASARSQMMTGQDPHTVLRSRDLLRVFSDLRTWPEREVQARTEALTPQ